MPQNRLIYTLKHHHRADVRRFVAEELTYAISAQIPNYKDFVFTYAPRGKRAILRYGYDHLKELTREMAEILGIPQLDVICRHSGGKEQKQLKSAERQKNMAGRFYPDERFDLKGKSVFLVDDIVTSGATLIEGARVLSALGVKEIVGVVIAATGRDENRKPRRFSVKYRTMK